MTNVLNTKWHIQNVPCRKKSKKLIEIFDTFNEFMHSKFGPQGIIWLPRNSPLVIKHTAGSHSFFVNGWQWKDRCFIRYNLSIIWEGPALSLDGKLAGQNVTCLSLSFDIYSTEPVWMDEPLMKEITSKLKELAN